MEWQTILESAIGSSPVAALSFYWAKVATRDRKEQEKQCQLELSAKDAIIDRKDELIQSLQNQRIADLKEVMVTTAPSKPKLPVSKPPF